MASDYYLICRKCDNKVMSHHFLFSFGYQLDPCGNLLEFLIEHTPMQLNWCEGLLEIITEYDI